MPECGDEKGYEKATLPTAPKVWELTTVPLDTSCTTLHPFLLASWMSLVTQRTLTLFRWVLARGQVD